MIIEMRDGVLKNSHSGNSTLYALYADLLKVGRLIVSNVFNEDIKLFLSVKIIGYVGASC